MKLIPGTVFGFVSSIPTHIHGGPEVEDAPSDDDVVVAADESGDHS